MKLTVSLNEVEHQRFDAKFLSLVSRVSVSSVYLLSFRKMVRA